jgi:hypothetical protein
MPIRSQLSLFVPLPIGAEMDAIRRVTLAHPRNPKAPGNDLVRVASVRDGRRVTFGEVHLIEQIDDAPWVVRGAVSLRASPR